LKIWTKLMREWQTNQKKKVHLSQMEQI